MKEIPTILCKPDGHLWRFFCPFCRSYHAHGGPPDANGNLGHRVAHCHEKSSPYHNGGYFLHVAQSDIIEK